MSNEEFHETKKQLDIVLQQVDKNHAQQSRLSEEAQALKDNEMRLRSELLCLTRTLCKKPWRYDSDSRLSGRYDDYFLKTDVLGRFDDYHAYIELEDGVTLGLCDGDVYLYFDRTGRIEAAEEKKKRICDFIAKWGIKIDDSALRSRQKRLVDEFEQIESVLAQIQSLQPEPLAGCCRLKASEPLEDNKVEQQAGTIQRLEQKLSRQKHQIKWMQDALRRKNLELDALHKVWCNGGCKTGVHRYNMDKPVTQELVDAAVKNTERLVTWWKNKQFRAKSED